MTKEQRDRAVAEAIAWMREDGGKFPGWGEDRLAREDKLATALLESLLLAYPQIRLVPVLATCRVHWLPRGPTTPRAWCRRIQNWAKCGAKWGDPLVVGPRSEVRGPGTLDIGRRTGDAPTRRGRSPEAAEGELTADQIRTWHDQPWAREP